MVNYSDIASKLIHGAINNGGETVYLNNMRKRFIVGVHTVCTYTMPKNINSNIPEIISDIAFRIANSAYNGARDTIGSWIDPDTNKLYIDYGTQHNSEAEARNNAIKRGEIAFYDMNTQTSINAED